MRPLRNAWYAFVVEPLVARSNQVQRTEEGLSVPVPSDVGQALVWLLFLVTGAVSMVMAIGAFVESERGNWAGSLLLGAGAATPPVALVIQIGVFGLAPRLLRRLIPGGDR